MKPKPITPRQRQILYLMREHDGPAMIAGGTRGFGWRTLDADHPGALVIRAYQEPDLWLSHKGLIEVVPMNAPGRWYRLTEAGRERASRIRGNPLA